MKCVVKGGGSNEAKMRKEGGKRVERRGGEEERGRVVGEERGGMCKI